MAQRSFQGGQELAKRIKLRRNELNMTIEEAALKAGVGTKTWSRYEAGAPIRMDKCKGICKALNWCDLSNAEERETGAFLIEEYKNHEAWSEFLADNYSDMAAASFAAGSDILLDYIKQDLSDLMSMPAGSHIGQLDTSFIDGELPPQFIMKYDYDFLYRMKCTLADLRMRAKLGAPIVAHSVMEELTIYLCSEEASALIELGTDVDELEKYQDLGGYKDWVFDLFDDMDIITFLYSDEYLEEDHPYHFSHWSDQQFYID